MTPDETMSTATNPNLRYTMDSVRAIEAIKEQIGNILRYRATEKALHEDRELVTGDDVLGSVAESLRDALKNLGADTSER